MTDDFREALDIPAVEAPPWMMAAVKGLATRGDGEACAIALEELLATDDLHGIFLAAQLWALSVLSTAGLIHYVRHTTHRRRRYFAAVDLGTTPAEFEGDAEVWATRFIAAVANEDTPNIRALFQVAAEDFYILQADLDALLALRHDFEAETWFSARHAPERLLFRRSPADITFEPWPKTFERPPTGTPLDMRAYGPIKLVHAIPPSEL